LLAAPGDVIIENNAALKKASMKAKIISGNVYVKNNGALTTFDLNCDKILGDVDIEKNNVLAETKILVQQAKGALKFKDNKLLKTIKMPLISKVGKDKDGSTLIITGNDKLENLHGLRGIQGILSGAITIAHNKALKNLEGLENILGVGKSKSHVSINVSGNDNLNSMMGLDGLKGKIPGSIQLDMNPSLKVLTGFQAITEIGADKTGKSLIVEVNKIMKDFLGFENLKSTEGALTIQNNPELTSIKGLRNLRSINGKDGKDESLSILYNPKLKQAQLLKLVTTKGGIVIDGNPNLENLMELAADIQKVGGDIVIKGVKCLGESEFAKLKKAGVKMLAKTTKHTCAGDVTTGKGQGEICGGTTNAINWDEWKSSGSTGLYLDVDTTKCNFDKKMAGTPNYVTSIVGDSAHWQLVGVNSVYKATPKGFRVYVWHPVMRGHFMKFFAHKYKWRLNWIADTGKTSGVTKAGATGWKKVANTNNILYVDVDTKSSDFKSTPKYITSIHGGSNHWRVTGAHAVYNPKKDSLRMYVVYPSAITPAIAEASDWTIAYVGSSDSVTSGSSKTADWQAYKAADAKNAVMIRVDTSAGQYRVMPTYVTSLTGDSHHLWATGGGSIYSASASSFKVYLDKVPSVTQVMKHNWAVNYVAYADAKDCQVSAYGPWSGCTKSCTNYGGTPGTDSRERTIVVSAYFGGNCPKLLDTRDCNTQICPENCVHNAWPNWSAVECSLSCGAGGQKKRARTIKTAATYGGSCEGALVQVKDCYEGECPIHCEVSAWGSWSTCSKSCGGSTVRRTRAVTQYDKHGGIKCPSLYEVKTCNGWTCPEDCKYSAWAEWSTCTKSCGGTESDSRAGLGTQFRSRKFLEAATYGGKACNLDTMYQTCNNGPCPIHCSVTEWSAFSECDKSCATGTKRRARSVIAKGKYGGTKCPTLTDTGACKVRECPVDCTVSTWKQVGGCSLTCSNGKQNWLRSRIVSPLHGGLKCPMLSKSTDCNTFECPVDCVLENWGTWGVCSTTCERGSTKRIRSVYREAKHGGKACGTEREQTKPCDEGKCPVHCIVSGWSNYGTCTKSCYDAKTYGTQLRTRRVVRHPAHGGYTCPTLRESRNCNTNFCPEDCVQSDWGSFEACTKSCTDLGGASGTQVRKRTVVRKATYGGEECGSPTMTRVCNSQTCPKDCVPNAWPADGGWSTCSVTCGIGSTKRSRSIKSDARNGGKRCDGMLKGSKSCNMGPCPIHCKVSDWTSWGTCTKTCGGGQKTRTRSITRSVAWGGITCPTLTETGACNVACCPITCILDDWTKPSACTKTCNGGSKTRTRKVLRTNKCGAPSCDRTTDTKACNTFSCPVDCRLGAWNKWETCSKRCYDGITRGTQKRHRAVTVPMQSGGVPCKVVEYDTHTVETQTCSPDRCPIHCKVNEWSKPGPCTKTCGGGQSKLTRTVAIKPKYGGTICPDLDYYVKCKTQPCPIDCEVGKWSEWFAYTKGGVNLRRVRSITKKNKFGGKKCPDLLEQKKHTVDCQDRSIFGKWSGCTKRCGTGHMYRHWERIQCSGKSTIKYHLHTRQGKHCNTRTCKKGEDPSLSTVDTPGITASDRYRSGIPEFEADRR
jgi:hypothetical protein